MVTFIDTHRDAYGVEPICAQVPIAPSTYYEHLRQRRDPHYRSERAKRGDQLKSDIPRVWKDCDGLYGGRKVWRQLRREKVAIASCTMKRLMRALGLAGVMRGRLPRTRIPSAAADRPLDLVQRRFEADAPKRLWVADINHVRCQTGFVDVAFVVDAFSRRIV